ncbi:hypothetical protein BAE44_0024018, partial [Dichanthelium oligosanthes]
LGLEPGGLLREKNPFFLVRSKGCGHTCTNYR